MFEGGGAAVDPQSAWTQQGVEDSDVHQQVTHLLVLEERDHQVPFLVMAAVQQDELTKSKGVEDVRSLECKGKGEGAVGITVLKVVVEVVDEGIYGGLFLAALEEVTAEDVLFGPFLVALHCEPQFLPLLLDLVLHPAHPTPHHQHFPSIGGGPVGLHQVDHSVHIAGFLLAPFLD